MVLMFDFLKNTFFPKKTVWTITPEFQESEIGKSLAEFDNAFQIEEKIIAPKVYKVTFGYTNFYLKKYYMFKRLLPRFISMSKVKTEWESFLFFKEVGIPAAKLVAYGQETRGRVVHRGVLITEELVGCQDLTVVEADYKDLLLDRGWIAKVSHQLADVARKMHQNHFAHNDFKWRNIMVDLKSDYPSVYLIDCPAGMKWYRPFMEHRIIKDLACLDKRAKYHLSKTQRLAYYKDYAQCSKLTAKDKKRLRKIVAFFQDRE